MELKDGVSKDKQEVKGERKMFVVSDEDGSMDILWIFVSKFCFSNFFFCRSPSRSRVIQLRLTIWLAGRRGRFYVSFVQSNFV
jgi:hypothetical protein